MKELLIKTTIVLILFSSILSGCTSGQKSLQRGNYYDAVMKAVNRLRSKPNQQKARETLRSSYPLSVDWFIDRSENALAGNAPDKWKQVVSNYQQINQMYEAIKRSPGALAVIPNPTNYYEALVEAKNNAADECYQWGLTAMNDQTREGAKKAYFHFIDADQYVPGFKDSRERMEEAKFLATLKVVVDQVPLTTRQFKVSADFFQENIESFLNSYHPNEFVRFFNTEEANNIKLSYPDHIVKVEFKDFLVGETLYEKNSEQLVREDVKVGELKITEDSTANVYGDVKAKYTVHKKAIRSSGILHMIIKDGRTNQILLSEDFPGEYIWASEWAQFNGDERALTRAQLAMTKRQELPPPDRQDLFVAFTQPIYDQITERFKSFYARY